MEFNLPFFKSMYFQRKPHRRTITAQHSHSLNVLNMTSYGEEEEEEEEEEEKDEEEYPPHMPILRLYLLL